MVLLSVGYPCCQQQGFSKSDLILCKSDSKDLECAIQYYQPERICSKSNKTKLIAQEDSCDVQFMVRVAIYKITCLYQDFELLS